MRLTRYARQLMAKELSLFFGFLSRPKVVRFLRVILWSVISLYFLFGLLILTTRYLLLPQVSEHCDDIANYLSSLSGRTIKIGAIETDWNHFWPSAKVKNIEIHSAQESDSIRIPSLNATLSWRSLLGTLNFRLIEIQGVELSLTRTKKNTLLFAGYELDLNAASTSPSDTSPMLRWLLDQKAIHLSKSNLAYLDENESSYNIKQFDNINITFFRGFRNHRFGMQCFYDGELVDFRARLDREQTQDVSNWKTWAGDLYLKLQNMDVATSVAGTFLSSIVKTGQGDAELWASLSKGQLTSITSDIALSEVNLQLTPEVAPLHAKNFVARISEKLVGNHYDVVIEDLTYRLPNDETVGPATLHGEFDVAQDTHELLHSKITISEVNLGILRRNFLASIPLSNATRENILKYKPRGGLQHLTFVWDGLPNNPKNWSVSSDFYSLGVHSAPNENPLHPGVPGFSRLKGRFETTAHNGYITLNTGASTLSFPGVFEHPRIPFHSIEGTVHWSNSENQPLTVTTQGLTLVNDDISLTATGSWKAQGSVAGTTDLTFTFDNARVPSVHRYMPIVIHKNVRQWLQDGLVSGTGHHGSGALKGDLMHFPWVTPGSDGLFYVHADIKDAAIDYVPSHQKDADDRLVLAQTWPLLTDIDGSITFRGLSMDVKANSAKTLNATIANTTASIPCLNDGQKTTLFVDGHVPQAPLSAYLNYLEKSPVGAILGQAFQNAEGTGQASLDLKLTIPLLNAQQTKVDGTITFPGNDLTMKWPIPPATELKGTIHFNEHGATAQKIQAKVFGHDTQASVQTMPSGQVAIRASGTTDLNALRYFYDSELLKTATAPFTGTFPYTTTVTIGKNAGVSVTAQSELIGLKSSYPIPYDKAQDCPWATNFTFKPYQKRGKTGQLVSLTIADKFDMDLIIPSGHAPLPMTGAIALGKTAYLPSKDLTLSVNADQASLSDWFMPVIHLIEAATRDSKSTTEKSGLLRSVTCDVKKLTFGPLLYENNHSTTVPVADGSWKSIIKSDQARGTVLIDYQNHPNGKVTGRFDYLCIPYEFNNNKDLPSQQHGSSAPFSLPDMDLKVRELALGSISLGTLSATASTRTVNGESVWSIEQGSVLMPDTRLDFSSAWNPNSTSSLKAHLSYKNGDKMLKRLALDNIGLTLTDGAISTYLTWKGAPWEFNKETLCGSLNSQLNKGALSEVNTGIGSSVLSVVSIQSLFKRLTLDFFDLTHSGYTFDSVTGDVLVTDGMLRTDNLKFIGPKASILFSGTSDTVAKTFDLKAVVFPDINAGGASLALALVNPTIGIGSLVTQLLLRDSLSEIFAEQYTITGPYSNPVITPTNRSKDVKNPLQTK